MSTRKRFEKGSFLLLLVAGAILSLIFIAPNQPNIRVPDGVHEPLGVGQGPDEMTVSSLAQSVSQSHPQQEENRALNTMTRPASTFQAGTLDQTLYLPFIYDPGPTTYYVSKNGANAGGRSWVSAWNELDQIDWTVIAPGDTILVDGGNTRMIYVTPLTVGKSGTADKPINISLANEPGRMGQVVLFGGRSTPLPYCWQPEYSFDTAGVKSAGIVFNDDSWIVIDGRKWRGIVMHGYNRNGIRLYRSASHITIRNVEIYDNGWAEQINGAWLPNGEGVDLAGASITFEYAIIHDNGQDAFQSGGDVADFTLKHAWLYNLRTNPSGNEPFNYCQHPDGIQIFDGGEQSGLVVEDSVVGPGFMQGVILGQTLTAGGAQAVINNVTLRNVLFTKAFDNNILGYHHTKPEGWVVDHITAHCPNTNGQCLLLDGSGHTIINSIFHSGKIYLPDGLSHYSGNCQWNTTGFVLGRIADPQFASVNDNDSFSLDDYALSATSPCTGSGSRITSVEQLLAYPGPDKAYP